MSVVPEVSETRQRLLRHLQGGNPEFWRIVERNVIARNYALQVVFAFYHVYASEALS